MKRNLCLIAKRLWIVMAAFVLVACNTNSDDDPPVGADLYSVEYVAEFGESWYQFYDITISYLSDGQVKTEQYQGPGPYHYVRQNIPAKDAKVFSFQVTATPKQPMPEYDAVGRFDFSTHFVSFGVKGNFDMQNPGVIFLDQSTRVPGVTASNLEDFIARNNGVIYNFKKVLSTPL